LTIVLDNLLTGVYYYIVTEPIF